MEIMFGTGEPPVCREEYLWTLSFRKEFWGFLSLNGENVSITQACCGGFGPPREKCSWQVGRK